MLKLLEAPRIPKEIKAPIKTRRKKTKTIQEGTEVKFTTIKEGGSSRVTQLFELYKHDRYKARVKYLSSPDGYIYNRLVIFEFGEKDFEITEFENKFGISITNRIYSSQKKLNSIIYKKGKFYRINNNGKKRGITPMTHYSLLDFIRNCENVGWNTSDAEAIPLSKVFSFMVSRFPWIKTVSETQAAHALAYNTIVSKDLTGQKELLRHVYKVPMNIVNIIQKDFGPITHMNNRNYIRPSNRARNIYDKLKQWKEVSKVLEGVQNLTEEMYSHPHFYDTCNMAHKLGRKVNCRWGIKKLEQMHDDWARDLRNILLDCEVEYMVKVRKPYFGLAKHTGWKLLFTNKEMLVEGVRQNHCVGGYIDRVERGECAIFHVEGFTLQVRIDKVAEIPNKVRSSITTNNLDLPEEVINEMLLHEIKTDITLIRDEKPIIRDEKPIIKNKLINVQFRGVRNCDPPKDLVERVNNLLNEYSDTQEFNDLVEGKLSTEEIKSITDEIYKTKWTVIINHETSKYEIEDKGLDGLEVKPVLDVPKKPNWVGDFIGYFNENQYNAINIRDEALPF